MSTPRAQRVYNCRKWKIIRAAARARLKGSTCGCCGGPYAARHGSDDPWDGRLDGFCLDCAWARCDAYPDECPNGTRT